jgi:uncharacterized protein (DUF1697 family)
MRYVGLVRNVMVGREGLHREVLLRLLDAAGGAHGDSYLATGNLLFDAAPSRLRTVVRRLEAGIEGVIGRHEPVVVRETAWVRAFVAADPFRGFPLDNWVLEVAFLPLAGAPIDPARLPSAEGLEVVAVGERELLTAGRRGAKWPGANRLLEVATGERATSRAWRTLLGLAGRGSGQGSVSWPGTVAARSSSPRT